MNSKQLAIGVFDSGMGGLTVLRALRAQLPDEAFIYLGDTARLPYGTKSSDTVKRYAVQMAKLLIERRIKALVIACSTATTAALSHLQAMLPDIPILGVVAPGAKAASLATKNQRILVFATETTIASGAYQGLISKENPQAFINTRVCSVLVALAEEGMMDNAVALEALKHYLDVLSDEDTLVLGCTHYPVFTPLLRRLLPSHMTIVDPAQATADALSVLLKNNNLLQEPQGKKVEVHYLVTDSVRRFQSVGAIFLGEELRESTIELVDAKS